MHLAPTAWVLRGSPDRTREMLAWERDTLGGHHALPLGLDYVDSKGTTELADYSQFFRQGRVALDPDVAGGLGLKPGQRVVYHTRRGYDFWGARYLILPARLAWNSLARLHVVPVGLRPDLPPSGDVRRAGRPGSGAPIGCTARISRSSATATPTTPGSSTRPVPRDPEHWPRRPPGDDG